MTSNQLFIKPVIELGFHCLVAAVCLRHPAVVILVLQLLRQSMHSVQAMLQLEQPWPVPPLPAHPPVYLQTCYLMSLMLCPLPSWRPNRLQLALRHLFLYFPESTFNLNQI